MLPVDQIFTFLKYVFSLGYCYYLDKKEKFLIQSLEDEQAMFALLELVGNSLNADRVELVYMHNGGGRLVPGVEKYVKVANEVCLTNKTIPRHLSHSRKVDNPYLSKVSKMMFAPESTIFIKVKDLPRGFLRTTYIEEGIQTAIATYLASNEKYMWYISIHFASDKPGITEEEMNDLNEYRGRIVDILKKYFTISHRC